MAAGLWAGIYPGAWYGHTPQDCACRPTIVEPGQAPYQPGDYGLFQLTLETFAQAGQPAPRPAIFHEVYKQSRDELMARLIDDWSLGAEIQGEMQDFFQQRPLDQSSSLSHSVYHGRFMAAVTLLAAKGLVSETAGQRLLLAKGLAISDLNITGRLAANPL